MTFRNFRDLSIGLLAIALIAAALRVVESVEKAAAAIDTASSGALTQIEGTRADLTKRLNAAADELHATRGDIDQAVGLSLKLLDYHAGHVEETLDQTVVGALKLADYHALQVEKRIDTGELLAAEVVKPIADTAARVADAAPLFLDCDHNADCVFNRYVGTARGIEQMAAAWGHAAPILTSDVEQVAGHVSHIAGDVQRVADNAVRPKSKKQILLESLEVAALVASKFF